jgi:NAD(P)-dependent dehydrogenase (short-subunit alcohol dehydrogenase family)
MYLYNLESGIMNNLEARTILVTGASKGIGKSIAELLGSRGANVIAQYGADREGAIEATQHIPDDRKLLLHADFADPASYKQLWMQSVAWKGRVDVLIANAAIMPEAELTDNDETWKNAWMSSMQVNSTAPAFLIREAVLHFLQTGGGNIIGISSWAAQRGSGNPKLSAYAASKSTIATFIKTIARAYGNDKIYAYLIAPGIVRTAMSETSAKSLGGEEAVTATLAMGEWVPPTEVAELVAFLATGKNIQLTGATLDVNGATYIR